MKALKVFGVTVLVFVAIYFVGGALLPSQWQTSQSGIVRKSPEQVYAYVANLKRWQQWSVWTDESQKMTSTYSGPDQGIGARWNWTSESMGDGYIKITDAEPAQWIRYDLVMLMEGTENFMMGEMVLSPVAEGTKVVWTDRGDAGNSTAKKWMALLIGFMVKRQMKQSLEQLDALPTP